MNLFEKIPTVAGKKVIALVNGSTGCKDRLFVSGQIIEIPVTESQLSEEWDFQFSLPKSQLHTIRPFLDISMNRVSDARIKMEILEGKNNTIVEGGNVVFSSGMTAANDNGYFLIQIGKELEPGRYTTRVQIFSDSDEGKDTVFTGGFGKLTVLSEDFDGVIVTSDIDQTFLDTQLHSVQGLVDTLFETPSYKMPIPGMPAFYRGLQKTQHFPLYFLSASPFFFRRTLGALFRHHGVDPSGLYLKSFTTTFEGIVRKVIHSVMNLDKILEGGMKHAYERSVKFLGSSFYNLIDQQAYKLTALLEHRLMQPTGAGEILIGDNTESDYFIYALYQHILLGKLSGKTLEDFLYTLRFHDRESFTAESAKTVAKLAELNLKIHGRTNSVRAVWIHRSKETPAEETMKKEITEGISAGLSLDCELEMKSYGNVMELAVYAFEEGILDNAQISEIWDSVKGKKYNGFEYSQESVRVIVNEMPIEDGLKRSLLAVLS